MDTVLPTKTVNESPTLSFEFGDEASSLTDVSIAVNLWDAPLGVEDDSPASLLDGESSTTDTTVLQKITGGVAYMTYQLRCQAVNQSGNIVTRTALLQVLP